MKQIVFTAFLILLFGCSVCGQSIKENCPQIRLSLPENTLFPERAETFSVKLEWDKGLTGLKYIWIISSGTINKGHGTETIEFIPKDDDQGRNIGIAVKVKGLPGHCADTVSEVIGVAQLSIGEPVDSFGKLSSFDFGQRFDVFLSALDNNFKNDPNYKGLIELRFDKSDGRTYKISRLKSIIKHLEFRKYDLGRIIFAISEGDYELTEHWIVPPGAKFPKSRHAPYVRISVENNQIIKAEELLQRINEICLRNGSAATK